MADTTGNTTATSDERFIGALNLTPAEQELYNSSTSLVGSFMSAVGIRDSAYKVVSDIVATRTPDQLLTALETANPDYAASFAAIRGDAQLKGALHNAFSKDPTVLEGIGTMIGADSAITPADLAKALEDPQNRVLMTGMLNGVAENPDLKFADLASAMESGVALSKDPTNAQNQQKWKDSLARFNLTDPRLDALSNPFAMIQQLFTDPSGVAKTLFDAFKDKLPPEYHNMLMGGLDQFMNGLSSFLDPKGDWVGHYVRIGQTAGTAIGSEWTERGAAILNPTTQQAAAHAGQGTPVAAGQGIDATAGVGTSFTRGATPTLYTPSADVAASIAQNDAAVNGWTQQRAASPGMAPQ